MTSVDTIDFTGAPATSLAIDLRGGHFEPGATPSALGPEIEWNLNWTDGFLLVNSAPGVDAIGLGLIGSSAAANLNRAHEDPWDAEAQIGDVQNVYLRGDNGSEFLSGAGSFAPFTEFSAPLDRPLTLDGGGGADMLHGGSSTDFIDGGGGRDEIVAGARPRRRQRAAAAPTSSTSRTASATTSTAAAATTRSARTERTSCRSASRPSPRSGGAPCPPRCPARRRGPAAPRCPSTRIAFSPRPSFSRPSVEKMSRPAQLLHPLEPVADRVAVGEEPLRRRRDVAVLVEVGLDGARAGRSRTARRRRPAAPPSPRRSAPAHRGPRSAPGAGVGRRPSARRRAPHAPRPRRRWRRAAPPCRRGRGRPGPRRGGSGRP